MKNTNLVRRHAKMFDSHIFLRIFCLMRNFLLILAGLGIFFGNTGQADAQDAVSGTGFVDVEVMHPNATAIGFMSITGTMNGYAGAEFRPDGLVNRAEMMKIMVSLLFGAGQVQSCDLSSLPFSDIDLTAWYSPYICVGYANNLLSGFPDGTFRPAENVNVVQAMKFAALVGGADLADGNPWFSPYATFLSDRWSLPLSLEALSDPITRKNVAEMLYRVNLWESKLSQVDNSQEEDAFWKRESLTLADVLSGARPSAFVPKPEPVLHMDPTDVYFAERLNQEHIDELLKAVNDERWEVEKSAELTLSRQLSWAAQVHADRLIAYDFFAHTTPGGDTVRDRTTASGFKAVYFGENLVRGARNAEEAIYKWSHSPKHYANLLDPVYTHVGIGWVIDEQLGGRYYVLLFAQQVPGAPGAEIRTNDTAGPAEGDDTIEYEELDASEEEIKPLSVEEALERLNGQY